MNWRARPGRSGVNRVAAIWQVVGLSVLIGMFALLAVACLAFGLTDLGPAVDAAHGRGALGTFRVTSRLCKSSSNCTLYGDFTSDDGAIRREYMLWIDGATAKVNVGDDLRALDTGDRSGVFRPSGSRHWVLVVIVILIGGLIAVAWLWLVPVRTVLRFRRRRLMRRTLAVPEDREYSQPRHAA